MIRRFLVLSAMVILAGCGSLQGGNDRFSNKEILAESRAACVEVLSDSMIKGTGAFISEDGLIITASHLFASDDVKVEVISDKYGRLQAKLLRRNRVADLALVQVESKGIKYPTLKLAKSMPDQGETVGCFGAALWNPIMLLKGKVANPAPNYCEYPASNGYMRCFFVSAAIPGLASGGPWINGKGELVGVQAGHLVDQGMDAGIAMVGRLDDIKKLIDAKKSIHTSGIRAWVWPLWTSDKAIIDSYPVGTQALLVNAYHSNSPLEKAGIKVHELIVSCDGIKVLRRADLFEIVKSKKPGSVVTFEVMGRDGKIRKVDVELADTESGTL